MTTASPILRSIVLDTFLSKGANVNTDEDKETIDYICEQISDPQLQLSAVVNSLSPLLISLHVAKDYEGCSKVINAILEKIKEEEEEEEESEEEEEMSKSPSNKSKPWTGKVDPYGGCTTVTPEQVIEITKNPDPKVRKDALRNMCPCHVKDNIESLWQRIMEMADDPDPTVRYQVMHNLCDGSPSSREDDVIRTLERMHNDPDKKVRRRVHQVLTHYRHTGKWNIL